MNENLRQTAHEMAKIYERDLLEVLQREESDPDYLPQEMFANSENPCYDRAVAINREAIKNCDLTGGVGIAKHRKEKHQEYTEKQSVEMEAQMLPEDVSVAKTKIWWQA